MTAPPLLDAAAQMEMLRERVANELRRRGFPAFATAVGTVQIDGQALPYAVVLSDSGPCWTLTIWSSDAFHEGEAGSRADSTIETDPAHGYAEERIASWAEAVLLAWRSGDESAFADEPDHDLDSPEGMRRFAREMWRSLCELCQQAEIAADWWPDAPTADRMTALIDALNAAARAADAIDSSDAAAPQHNSCA